MDDICKIKVVKKGYTITVTSWENDGDHTGTKTLTVQNKEYALAVLKICQDIFVSCSNGGIGNTTNEDFVDIILDYVKDKPILVNEDNPDAVIDIIMDLNFDIMGISEFYISRVFDNGYITYSDSDIFLTKIA